MADPIGLNIFGAINAGQRQAAQDKILQDKAASDLARSYEAWQDDVRTNNFNADNYGTKLAVQKAAAELAQHQANLANKQVGVFDENNTNAQKLFNVNTDRAIIENKGANQVVKSNMEVLETNAAINALGRDQGRALKSYTQIEFGEHAGKYAVVDPAGRPYIVDSIPEGYIKYVPGKTPGSGLFNGLGVPPGSTPVPPSSTPVPPVIHTWGGR